MTIFAASNNGMGVTLGMRVSMTVKWLIASNIATLITLLFTTA